MVKLFEAPTLTVLVAKFVKHKVEKNALDKTKMKKRFVKLAEAFANKDIKVEDGIPTISIDAARSLNPPTDISENRLTNPDAYSTSPSTDESDFRRYHFCHKKRSSRCHRTPLHHRSPTALRRKQSDCHSSLKVRVPMN